MTAATTATSSVEVAVDPATAFAVFTEEIGCWWLQGPINFFDSTTAYGLAIESGVGGRIVEVQDQATGDGLELARITAWEPGVRLAWRSSVDDVETEVRFDPSSTGTVVRVVATIPPGGSDQGGTAWVRVVPDWLAGWVAVRDQVPRTPVPLARLAVAVHYAQQARAARWLRDVFGFDPASAIPEDDVEGGDAWIEFRVGTSAIFVFGKEGSDNDVASVTHTPWVFVDDLDRHYARVRDAGARIVEEIWQHGARAYSAADLEGNHWTFAQAAPLAR